ncbi:MAG: hypothetical protein AB4352_12475 [Hormoscilla sp.]
MANHHDQTIATANNLNSDSFSGTRSLEGLSGAIALMGTKLKV